jgi:hypothetical protein
MTIPGWSREGREVGVMVEAVLWVSCCWTEEEATEETRLSGMLSMCEALYTTCAASSKGVWYHKHTHSR